MEHKKYAMLLFNAVRETLETMAFAEVIPCAMMLGDQQLNEQDFDTAASDAATIHHIGPVVSGWGDPTTESESHTDTFHGDSPDETDEAGHTNWGELGTQAVLSATIADGEGWGAAPDLPAPPNTGQFFEGDWGENSKAATCLLPAEMGEGTDTWGKPMVPGDVEVDPWGDTASIANQGITGLAMKGSDVDFDQLADKQDDWVWSCMRVNSEDIHSVWFIVSKTLAFRLAEGMYAGEITELDSPIVRDLVAELTNVLGGKLMLLLEELGGKFTLAVPEIGIGMPKLPDTHSLETVFCKVLVDNEYPVMTSICFNEN